MIGMQLQLSRVLITGKRIYLRKFEVKDISDKYIFWLNDPQVNKFLSTRSQHQTYEVVKSYVELYQKKKNGLLLGIFLKENEQHIGNLTLSHIDWENNFAVVGVCIGDKDYWKQGYGEEVLGCIKKLVFEKLRLNRLKAGVCEENVASVELFKKSGFKIEKKWKTKLKIDDIYCNGLMMGLSKEDYENQF